MGDGRIEAVGTHEELAGRGGAYTALHSGQPTKTGRIRSVLVKSTPGEKNV